MHRPYLYLYLFLLLSAGCKTLSYKQSEKFPAFSAEGHRGARGLMPENSIPAMIRALELGVVTTLEMDTHISSDKQVFLAHDHYLNPLFVLKPDGTAIPESEDKKYPLYAMTYEQIRQYDTGSKGNSKFPEQQRLKTHMPLLADVIDTVQAYIKKHNRKQVFYNIETKSTVGGSGDGSMHPAPEEFVDLLVAVLKQKEVLPYVVIQSFDIRTIQVVNRKYPQIKTSFLVENTKSFEENMLALGYTPFIYSPNSKLITPELVKQCHDRNIKIIPWTVNTAQEIARLRSLGVDGIITDYPNLFAQ